MKKCQLDDFQNCRWPDKGLKPDFNGIFLNFNLQLKFYFNFLLIKKLKTFVSFCEFVKKKKKKKNPYSRQFIEEFSTRLFIATVGEHSSM